MQSLVKSNVAVGVEGSKATGFANIINSDYVKKRFADVLGSKAPQFLASVAGAVNVNPKLKACEGKSIVASAMIAATLDLEVVPSFGFAALVPYEEKKTGRKVCQFQIMTKGIVQLALRSGQFKAINVGKLYKDEIIGYDPIKGTFEISKDSKMRKTGKDKDIAGYFCYFALVNGFEKTEFWSIEEIVNHGKKYSQSYQKGYGLWVDNFEAMAEKTVLKNTLSKYAPLSTQMRNAIIADQGTFEGLEDAENVNNFKIDYVDEPIKDCADVTESEGMAKNDNSEAEKKVNNLFENPKGKGIQSVEIIGAEGDK